MPESKSTEKRRKKLESLSSNERRNFEIRENQETIKAGQKAIEKWKKRIAEAEKSLKIFSEEDKKSTMFWTELNQKFMKTE